MSVGVSESPIHAFYQFLGRRLDGGDADLTPEQSVREFRLYQGGRKGDGGLLRSTHWAVPERDPRPLFFAQYHGTVDLPGPVQDNSVTGSLAGSRIWTGSSGDTSNNLQRKKSRGLLR